MSFGIQVSYIFLNLTMHGSKLLCLTKEREKTMTNEPIPGVVKEICIVWNRGDLKAQNDFWWNAEGLEIEPTENGNKTATGL